MKKTLLIFGLSAVAANAAITIGGAAATNAKGPDGATNIPTGSVVLLVVDTTGNGFFNFGVPAAGTQFTATADPLIAPAAAGLTIGSTFGGEFVLNVLASGAGSISSLLTNVSVASYLDKQFAVVYFNGSVAGSTAPGGTSWGVIRGSDWVFPSADTGTFTMSSTDANGASSYYQVNAATPAANSAAFWTSSTVFKVVPEPSSILLGAVGALGLLRRRRN